MNKFSAFSVFLLPVILIGVASAQPLAAEDNFGRLFSSPAERKKLDLLRKNQQMVAPQQKNKVPEPIGDDLPESITMQGYVKRSDGTTTLWVNNRAVYENSTHDQFEIGRLSKQNRVAKDGSEALVVRIPATGKNLRLKAGQVYEPENDRIIELRQLEKEKQLELKETGLNSSSHAE